VAHVPASSVTISLVTAFLLTFAWLSPKIFRLLHVSWTALRRLITKAFGGASEPVDIALPATVSGTLRRALEELPFQHAPEAYVAKAGQPGMSAIHCVATGAVPGFKNSTGYLFITRDELVFVAQRLFRLKVYRRALADIHGAGLRRGLFLDPLVLKTADRDIGFDVFKGKRARVREDFTPSWQAP